MRVRHFLPLVVGRMRVVYTATLQYVGLEFCIRSALDKYMGHGI